MGQKWQEYFRVNYQRNAVLNVSQYSHYTKNIDRRSQSSHCLKAWVSGRSLDGTEGSNPAGGTVWSLASVVCYKIEVSATANYSSRSHTVCGVSNQV